MFQFKKKKKNMSEGSGVKPLFLCILRYLLLLLLSFSCSGDEANYELESLVIGFPDIFI